MPRTWQFPPHDESRIKQLSGRLGVSPLLARVLIARGYASPDEALRFLNARPNDLHEPALLPGIDAAADVLLAAIRARRRVTIYGDYDVDGVTGASLLWHCLKLAGADVDYYIPSRLEEGYGLNADAVRQLHALAPEQLLVTVDCGISAADEVALARELGLGVIVTDHHQFGPALPPADALVHPRLPGSQYPFDGLCGAGVAFKLAWGVCQRLGDGRKSPPQMREFLKRAVGLAAIGTIADVVPLLGENRVIVRYGLDMLRDSPPLGLLALLQVAGLYEKPRLDAEDIGFGVAPRINAAGRLGQARLAVELLTTDHADRAGTLAAYLDQLNRNRQSVERRIFKQARELVERHPQWRDAPALVLGHDDWHPGVVGIVAGRVAEHYEKPAILVSVPRDGTPGQGSGRSYGSVDLHSALSRCRDHLVSFGGHQQAAGLRIRADRLDRFREDFCRILAETQPPADAAPSQVRVDAEVRLADVSQRAVRELERLGPFGAANPRPLFAATRVELAEPPRRMGEGGRHVSMRLRQYGATLRAVAFGRGEWADEIAALAGRLAVCFAPVINHYRGRESVELQLKDWQPDE